MKQAILVVKNGTLQFSKIGVLCGFEEVVKVQLGDCEADPHEASNQLIETTFQDCKITKVHFSPWRECKNNTFN
jgi:hypothetical protein